MAKFLLAFAVIVLFIASCSAQAPRSTRRLRNRSRFLARQEIQEPIPAQTPYPPAGDKPDLEFDLPTDETEDLGDQVAIGVPDRTYGPPETEAVPEGAQEDFGAEPESQRFTSIRGNNRFIQQGRRIKAAPLKKAAPLVAAPQLQLIQPQQQQILAQPILLADGRVVYSVFQ